VKTIGVVELKVVVETAAGVIGRGIVLQVDLFALDSTPEAFGKEVVERALCHMLIGTWASRSKSV